jgi:hypothetical protein
MTYFLFFNTLIEGLTSHGRSSQQFYNGCPMAITTIIKSIEDDYPLENNIPLEIPWRFCTHLEVYR